MMKFRYFLIFFIPQKAKNNSKISPAKKYIDGSPSNTKLNSLPNAKPPIKTIFVKVAVAQNLVLIIPIIQDNPRYNPMIALKTFSRLMVSTLISNNLNKITSEYKPYIKAIGIIKMTDINKWRFLIAVLFLKRSFNPVAFFCRASGKIDNRRHP